MSICPMCKFEITNCPQCGYAAIFFPRHAPRGSGAHYAKRMGRLTRTHKLALEILRSHEATSYEKGMGLSQIWREAREICMKLNQADRVPTKQGISGRLSELAGLGVVKTQSHVQLVDFESMQFRAERQPRWFLADGSRT